MVAKEPVVQFLYSTSSDHTEKRSYALKGSAADRTGENFLFQKLGNYQVFYNSVHCYVVHDVCDSCDQVVMGAK